MGRKTSHLAVLAWVAAFGWAARSSRGQDVEAVSRPDPDRELRLETVGAGKGPLPEKLRLTLKNAAKEPYSFTEPAPILPEAMEEAPHVASVLGLDLADEHGRPSQFQAVWADTKHKKGPAPKTITLKPGETWVRELPISAFYFWGPCGPSAVVSDFLKPGKSEVEFSAILLSRNGTIVRSNPFKAKVKIPANFFVTADRAPHVEDVDGFMELMKDAPSLPGEPASVAEIVKLLGDRSFDMRLHGIHLLRRLGPDAREAVPSLLQLLDAEDARDRLAALYALEAIGPAAKDTIAKVQALAKDAEARVREKAAETAAAIQGKAVEATGVPTYAGKPVTYWLAEASRERPSPVKARAAAKKDAQEEEEEEDDATADDRRWKARSVVINMGGKAVPYLLEALKPEDADSRWTIVSILQEIIENGGAPDEVLVAAITKGAEPVRRGVVEALGGGKLDFGPTMRRGLSAALISTLVKAIEDPDPSVRAGAARALGHKGAEGAVPGLLSAAKSKEPEVREAVAKSLGRIGAAKPEVLEALKALAVDENALVRSAASKSLEALGERGAGAARFGARLEEYVAARKGKEPVKEVAVESMEKLPVDLPADSCGVFFVVDRSGTAEEYLEPAKALIERALARLGPGADFGIVFVDQKALSYPGDGSPAKADEAGRKKAAEFLKGIELGPGSCPMEGFHAALNLADRSKAARKIVYYIGDGGGTCGGIAEEDYLELTFDAITMRNHGQVEIHTLGIGTAPLCQSFLRYISEKNGGVYTHGSLKEEDAGSRRRKGK